MTSKELVSGAIEFKGPEKLPLRYVFSAEKSDIVSVGYSPAQGWKAGTVKSFMVNMKDKYDRSTK